jgi:hypothetical protein
MKTLQIKWRYSCCLLLLCCSLKAYTQINIFGRVITDSGSIPVAGASVYFNNTTCSTTTNKKGEFEIAIPFFLNTALVISSPDFELLVYNPAVEQITGVKFVFKLMRKNTTAPAKAQLSKAVKKRWFGIFLEGTLGPSEEASKCIISNPAVIYFINGDAPNSFSVLADSPVVFINTMLGYKITVDLEVFTFDAAAWQNNFVGYARYEALPGDQNKFIKNRRHCFYGSSMHFYRSLIANQLAQQGFGTFLIKTADDTTNAKLELSSLLKLDYGITYAVPITAQQILYIDSTNNFSIRISNPLLVQYTGDPVAKNFLYKKSLTEGLLDKGVESVITLKSTIAVGINSAGVPGNTVDLLYEGYWRYERIANTLPYDYRPE